jgi:hypothetical protein
VYGCEEKEEAPDDDVRIQVLCVERAMGDGGLAFCLEEDSSRRASSKGSSLVEQPPFFKRASIAPHNTHTHTTSRHNNETNPS